MIIYFFQVFAPLALITSEVPPGDLTDFDTCKLSHLGLEYLGTESNSESGIRCQSWSSDQPHKIKEDIKDVQFADGSKKKARNYCRNPTKSSMGPWCYTMNYDLQFDTCGLPLCSLSQCKITGPGMEYAGKHNKGSSGK